MLEVSANALRRVRHSYHDLSLPLPALLLRLADADDDQWLRVDDAQDWLRDAQGQLLPAAVRQQLGADLMHNWYHAADGFAHFPQGLQVLADHLCAAGDGGLVRQAAGLGGRLQLRELDAVEGRARVAPGTAIDPDWGCGLLQGALDAAGDLLYSEVQWHAEAGEYRLRFVSEANRATVRWATDACEDARLWRLRNRVRQLEQHNAYLVARGPRAEGSTPSGSTARVWIDPLTGAVPEAQLRDRLLSMTQIASLVPPRICLVGFACASQPSDAMLQWLGRVGQSLTRRDDLLARLGPHGLALLLADAEPSTGQRIVERLRSQLPGDADAPLRTVVMAWPGGSVSNYLVRAKATLFLR